VQAILINARISTQSVEAWGDFTCQFPIPSFINVVVIVKENHERHIRAKKIMKSSFKGHQKYLEFPLLPFL